MYLRIAAVAVIALLTGGCLSVAVGPELRVIVGTVHYQDGGTVDRAKVWVASGASTFCDAQGHFRLVVRNVGDTTLFARNGYEPGRVFAVTCWGRVALDKDTWQTHDMILDSCGPI